MLLNITEREFATLLAALRFWGRVGPDLGGAEMDIATNGGVIEPMSEGETDALAERLNEHEPTCLYMICGADEDGADATFVVEARNSDEAIRLWNTALDETFDLEIPIEPDLVWTLGTMSGHPQVFTYLRDLTEDVA